ncbi:YqhA family protein, partial [Synechococcus sp. CS-1331]|uniref:YqhA family protein n=1 Tax=Synechococcus sp. CS-1331 TaxID=2847973 RepID=UPI00223A71DF
VRILNSSRKCAHHRRSLPGMQPEIKLPSRVQQGRCSPQAVTPPERIHIFKSIKFFFFAPDTAKVANTALASVVSGIDFYLIGVAFLIFGYGLYELLISEIDVYRAGSDTDNSGGLLDIRSLDHLKEKLVKVLVVALIVSAFKSMITIPLTDVKSMIYFCLCVLILALSGFLMTYKPASKS